MLPPLRQRMLEAINSQEKPATEEIQAYLLEKYNTDYTLKRIAMYIYYNLKGTVQIEKRKSKSNRYYT